MLPMSLEHRLELPPHLDERSRWRQPFNSDSETFVLYWMQTAQRADENPALEVAIHAARQLNLPLLVYQGLSERYEYASDRHHTFILQSVADLQERFAELGISYAFHLESHDNRGPHLRHLAAQASLLVVEEMPVAPATIFLKALLRSVSVPVISVDTSCVLPMQQVGRSYERAFEFRDATRKGFAERVTLPWPDGISEVKPFPLDQLRFQPTRVEKHKIPDLVARCQIDHSVSPVADTPGGSTAGYRRWQAFLKGKIRTYAKRRNDPLSGAASRMSAYLHYGMVSPMRLARDAEAVGAEKYLDELLIWRELAYNFCFYRHDVDRITALPHWARSTLLEHADDARPQTFSWEELARGQTGDDLWDSAQGSLLRHGELHNNLRMTWGKALLNWTAGPQQALSMLIDLNHRYALDGRDPASYGGILWCLGLFDRPFHPERSTLGTVRGRGTKEHRKRLDLETYRHNRGQPNWGRKYRVAVIGAGLAGMTASRTLRDQGVEIEVFEKSRGLGGRMATRRINGQSGFDHGAQYFTARHPIFRRYVESWIQQGGVQRWTGSVGAFQDGIWKEGTGTIQRFVGIPSMNAICKHLGEGIEVHKQTRIERVKKMADGLILVDDHQKTYGHFDGVIVTAPAFQAHEILCEFPEMAQQLKNVEMDPCWAAMLTLKKPLEPFWVGAFIQDSFLSWAARNGTKPGRASDAERLILHAAPAWTDQHWESDPEWVGQAMAEEFVRVSGLGPLDVESISTHRWKYAIAREPLSCGALVDSARRIVACGDWAMGSRVEGAFLSGLAAAGRLMGQFAQNTDSDPREQLSLF
jgi:photolyase PhrII